ncbi:MAG: hypothetical protein F9K29_21405 [Hyphomicrobiaceae bacterium]|nr:MAG: hypothetical protein F9K29_21405 [Hyphomicrobiaceae bacterium]
MNAFRRYAGRAATACALILLAAPAYADGMRRGSIKDAPAPEKPRCTFSANVGLTTDYVFRGFSQTAEGPAVQGGFDATCGLFYAGVWASALDFDGGVGSTDVNSTAFDAHLEMDWYLGIKPVTGKITWDLGVIYYTYPNAQNPGLELNYVELKVGASGEIWKDGTLGVTVFYSPDYQLEGGTTWTVETAFSQVLPKIGMLSPTFSALVGYQHNEGSASYRFSFGNTDDSYWYWNAGVTFGFLEKFSLDLRYWDTNLENNGPSAFCKGSTFQCDERFVATLKFTY